MLRPHKCNGPLHLKQTTCLQGHIDHEDCTPHFNRLDRAEERHADRKGMPLYFHIFHFLSSYNPSLTRFTQHNHDADLEVSNSNDEDIADTFKHAHHVDHLEEVKDSPEVKRIMRKIDMRLLPCLAVIYAFALIDRVNLPNARIAGMDEDLQLQVGERYSLITMMFFVPYVRFFFYFLPLGFFSNRFLHPLFEVLDTSSYLVDTSEMDFNC